MSRASWRTTRSAYRCRTRVSSERSLCRVGSGRSALLAISQDVASTDSSPRRLEMTRPSTTTWSPMSTSAFQSASDSSPTSARLTITCRRVPMPSWRVAKQSLPVLRTKTTRPATRTTSSVSSPVSRWPHCSRTCWRVCVRLTSTGYASRPLSSSRCRLSRRTRICSGTSSTVGSRGWPVTGQVWPSHPFPLPTRGSAQFWRPGPAKTGLNLGLEAGNGVSRRGRGRGRGSARSG